MKDYQYYCDKYHNLYDDFYDGNEKAVSEAIDDILQANLTDKEKEQLLRAEAIEIEYSEDEYEEEPYKAAFPGLCAALHYGHADVVKTFMSKVSNSSLSEKTKNRLFFAKSGSGVEIEGKVYPVAAPYFTFLVNNHDTEEALKIYFSHTHKLGMKQFNSLMHGYYHRHGRKPHHDLHLLFLEQEGNQEGCQKEGQSRVSFSSEPFYASSSSSSSSSISSSEPTSILRNHQM